MLSYDPDKTPELDPEAMEEALSRGLHAVNVVCDEPGAKVGDHTGVNFIAYFAFVPRKGDDIKLEDGTCCRVKGVMHVMTHRPGSSLVMGVPNILAIRTNREDEEARA